MFLKVAWCDLCSILICVNNLRLIFQYKPLWVRHHSPSGSQESCLMKPHFLTTYEIRLMMPPSHSPPSILQLIFKLKNNPFQKCNSSKSDCITANMPVCLALLNLLSLCQCCAALPVFLLASCFSPASLWSVDLLTPEVVMNFARGTVYTSSVYAVNLCALVHA